MRKKRIVTFVSLSAFYMGISTVIAALIYMIVNLNLADSIVNIWSFLMVSGATLVYMSQWLKYNTAT